MSVAKGIIDLHGGYFTIASEGHGKGSCFSIDLLNKPITPSSSNQIVRNTCYYLLRRLLCPMESPSIYGRLSSTKGSVIRNADRVVPWRESIAVSNEVGHHDVVKTNDEEVKSNIVEEGLDSYRDRMNKSESCVYSVDLALSSEVNNEINNHNGNLGLTVRCISADEDESNTCIMKYNSIDISDRDGRRCTYNREHSNTYDYYNMGSSSCKINRLRSSIEDSLHSKFDEKDGIFSRKESLSMPTFTKDKRILVVDDVSMNRKMLKRLLEKRFNFLAEATNGQQAVDMVRAALEEGAIFHYDVITMDYQMPVMDGVTATKIIRNMGFKGKIIAVTGNALEDDVLTFKASGADIVLMKPLDIKVFDEFLLT